MRISNVREFCKRIALSLQKKLPSRCRSANNTSNQQPLREQIPIKNQIKFKLIIAFCIPVVLIISSGIFTYLKAKNAAIENYEISTLGNIQNSALYCDLLMTDIETKASQMSSYNDFIVYYNRFSSNSTIDSNTFYNNAKSTLSTLVKSSVGIYNAYAFGKEGNPLSTLSYSPKSTLYENFLASEERKSLEEHGRVGTGYTSVWIGNHEIIDQEVSAAPEFYIASYVRGFSKGMVILYLTY